MELVVCSLELVVFAANHGHLTFFFWIGLKLYHKITSICWSNYSKLQTFWLVQPMKQHIPVDEMN